ncbi:hypothetical protein AUN00_11440 [Cronobacter sakazakii]|uniref:Uncharacterized protein n=1 Tax=Cronobacter malonaticus TaxID=413503 RepID=A0ABX5K602_9ENTR|nr:hypothetical protein [Cronobacter sakazakii]PUX04056.1 hypothetical protein AUN13_22250 [Cronobacter malonaticus]EGT5749867.1 hypothetical protein [Cronobacter sakazakii]EGT5766330.1 hypothetical protein [Cronobacter sakazakii]PUW17110.1 hypothetical protein AUN00_11440 [Cronobacter sakazakii]
MLTSCILKLLEYISSFKLLVSLIDTIAYLEYGVKWFTEFGHLNRGDMLTSEQYRCTNETKKF